MWIREQTIKDLLAAQRDTNATIASFVASLTEQTRSLGILADMVKRNESTTNTRLEGIERTLVQYAGDSANMVAATLQLVQLKETLELRVAALQFTVNQLTKHADKADMTKKK